MNVSRSVNPNAVGESPLGASLVGLGRSIQNFGGAMDAIGDSIAHQDDAILTSRMGSAATMHKEALDARLRELHDASYTDPDAVAAGMDEALGAYRAQMEALPSMGRFNYADHGARVDNELRADTEVTLSKSRGIVRSFRAGVEQDKQLAGINAMPVSSISNPLLFAGMAQRARSFVAMGSPANRNQNTANMQAVLANRVKDAVSYISDSISHHDPAMRRTFDEAISELSVLRKNANDPMVPDEARHHVDDTIEKLTAAKGRDGKKQWDNWNKDEIAAVVDNNTAIVSGTGTATGMFTPRTPAGALAQEAQRLSAVSVLGGSDMAETVSAFSRKVDKHVADGSFERSDGEKIKQLVSDTKKVGAAVKSTVAAHGVRGMTEWTAGFLASAPEAELAAFRRKNNILTLDKSDPSFAANEIRMHRALYVATGAGNAEQFREVYVNTEQIVAANNNAVAPQDVRAHRYMFEHKSLRPQGAMNLMAGLANQMGYPLEINQPIGAVNTSLATAIDSYITTNYADNALVDSAMSMGVEARQALANLLSAQIMRGGAKVVTSDDAEKLAKERVGALIGYGSGTFNVQESSWWKNSTALDSGSERDDAIRAWMNHPVNPLFGVIRDSISALTEGADTGPVEKRWVRRPLFNGTAAYVLQTRRDGAWRDVPHNKESSARTPVGSALLSLGINTDLGESPVVITEEEFFANQAVAVLGAPRRWRDDFIRRPDQPRLRGQLEAGDPYKLHPISSTLDTGLHEVFTNGENAVHDLLGMSRHHPVSDVFSHGRMEKANQGDLTAAVFNMPISARKQAVHFIRKAMAISGRSDPRFLENYFSMNGWGPDAADGSWTAIEALKLADEGVGHPDPADKYGEVAVGKRNADAKAGQQYVDNAPGADPRYTGRGFRVQ